MKLTEFEHSKVATTQKALKENYGVSMNIENMPVPAAKTMLKRIKGLIHETKQSSDFYKNKTLPLFMKLRFMEQALSHHIASSLQTQKNHRIVVENEEVEKSQVVLAAQDMVDSVQKMIEQVSDMLVKELPALTDAVQSEIGANESTQFNSQASEALTSLQSALTSSQSMLKSALNNITGQGNVEEFQPATTADDDEVESPEFGGEDEDLDIPDEDQIEEPDSLPLSSVGRSKR